MWALELFQQSDFNLITSSKHLSIHVVTLWGIGGQDFNIWTWGQHTVQPTAPPHLQSPCSCHSSAPPLHWALIGLKIWRKRKIVLYFVPGKIIVFKMFNAAIAWLSTYWSKLFSKKIKWQSIKCLVKNEFYPHKFSTWW